MATYIPIEKGVPLGSPHPRHYPLAEMEVGDSFLVVEPRDRSIEHLRLELRAYLPFWRRQGREYQTKIYHEENALRVWRIQ